MSQNDVPIDIERLGELINQYDQTDDRERQREIENEVLSETVWQDLSEIDDEMTFTPEDIRRVYGAVPDDAHEAKRILRRPWVEKL
jgi:transcriptional regulator NrdR family protein